MLSVPLEDKFHDLERFLRVLDEGEGLWMQWTSLVTDEDRGPGDFNR